MVVHPTLPTTYSVGQHPRSRYSQGVDGDIRETYRPSVTHAIGRHDAEAHLQEHGDLIPPSHRDVREAMDLRGPGKRLSFLGLFFLLPRQK